jgi:choline dehydrogenase-like flavoprotein
MEHLNTDFEGLLLGSPSLPDGSYYLRQTVHEQQVWGYFELAPPVREREGLLAAAMVLLPGQPDELMESLRHTIADTDSPGAAVTPGPVIVCIGTASEQAPNPASRVVLGEERDQLGVPRAALDWRLSEQDQRSLARTHAIFAEAIAYSGLGRVKVTQWPGRPFPEHTHGGRHHLGTTRMHADPRQGVVDANSRVHGVDNLYIAGSSVFPTGGAANPTLTIVALAQRLASHLAEVA